MNAADAFEWFPHMTSADMLGTNRHYQAMPAAAAGTVIVYPFKLRPAFTLPMTDAAALSVVIEVAVDTDYIQIHVHRVSGIEHWARLPERRNMSRRVEMANTLRDAAALYSLDAFLAYIADCGFTRQ